MSREWTEERDAAFMARHAAMVSGSRTDDSDDAEDLRAALVEAREERDDARAALRESFGHDAAGRDMMRVTRQRDEARAEVERLRALVDPVTLGPDTEPGRAGGDVVWEDPQVVVDRLNAANVKAERERDEALLEVERLRGLLAEPSEEEEEKPDTQEVRREAAYELSLHRAEAEVERLRGELAEARETIGKLQDDVVSLTQAGDLHRKEGDEARDLLAAVVREVSDDGLTQDTMTRIREALAEAPRVSGDVLGEVRAERARQDAKWGPQNHPDADPVILGLGLIGPDLCMELEIPSQERAKELCRAAGNRGADHWGAIIVEELAEAIEAIGNDAALRAELVQVAAVAVAWVEAIDRRQAVSRG